MRRPKVRYWPEKLDSRSLFYVCRKDAWADVREWRDWAGSLPEAVWLVLRFDVLDVRRRYLTWRRRR